MRFTMRIFGGMRRIIIAFILAASGLAAIGVGIACFYLGSSSLGGLAAALIITAVALAVLIGAFLFSQRISASLVALREGAEKLALGDLDYRVDLGAGDELRGLTASFNRMAEAIKSSHELMEHRVKERADELRVLNEMVASLGRNRSPDEILQKCLGSFMEFVGYEVGCAYLVGEAGWNLLYSRYPANYRGHLPQFIAAGAGVLGRIIEAGRAVFVEEVGEAESQWAISNHPQGAFAVLPLRSSSRIMGALLLASGRKKSIKEESRSALRAMADEVGIALEKAMLFNELQNNVAVLERANQELRGLDEMKSNFISAVTHELKQPLALISGYAQTIYDYYENLTYEEEMHCLRVIMERTQFLTGLVEDLLDLSMLEMGRIQLQYEELDMVSLARKTAAEQDTGEKDLRIKLDFPSDFPVVYADTRRMEQVISNLLSNAVKFSHGQGEIRLSGRVAGGRLRMRVEDEGVGIDPSNLTRIFDRFYQADASRRRRYPGVGLGLFICRQLVEAHDGTIWADNLPGGGSAFTFEIPLSREEGR
jgi:signal transduction histidine kinase/HAMP domain-containing protein